MARETVKYVTVHTVNNSDQAATLRFPETSDMPSTLVKMAKRDELQSAKITSAKPGPVVREDVEPYRRRGHPVGEEPLLSLSEEVAASVVATKPVSKLTADELRAEAEMLGVKTTPRMSNAKLIEAIDQARAENV